MFPPVVLTEPTPLLMLAVAAFAVVQVRVEDWPWVIVVGFAKSVHVGGEGGITPVPETETWVGDPEALL